MHTDGTWRSQAGVHGFRARRLCPRFGITVVRCLLTGSEPMASQSNLETAVIQSVNDFVVKFANVNGSGSASANALFAKSILRMGIPASSRNIFPSNIQGLPTWYEVRISDAGHLGRRGGVDMMVAMNRSE